MNRLLLVNIYLLFDVVAVVKEISQQFDVARIALQRLHLEAQVVFCGGLG